MSSTPRAQIAAALAASLPDDIKVMPYARNIDPPAQTTVMVRLDRVEPHPAAKGPRRYTFALVILAALTDPSGPADDELDNALEDVLHVIDKAPAYRYEKAERATYANTTPAYEVTIQAAHTPTAPPEE